MKGTKSMGQRLDKIYQNDQYQRLLNQLKVFEKDRMYCRHNEEHFLAVARIAYEKCLEQAIPVSKELLYCAAFLHDIGKGDQYQKGIPHEIASEKYAREILRTEGFSQKEMDIICKLILDHRKGPENERDALSTVFYQADKKSRNCFCCPVSDSCNWSEEQKNSSLGNVI